MKTENFIVQACLIVVCTHCCTALGNGHRKAVTTRQLFRYHYNYPGQYSIWHYTERNLRGVSKTRSNYPSPPAASPLGQGRAEPQRQTWRGCCQLFKVQGTALPDHESPTPFFMATQKVWALLFAPNTHTGWWEILHDPVTIY